MNNPEIGAKATRQLTVTKNQLASSVGSGTVDVFATPMVAALMEGAACDLAARYIEDIYTTVGSEICVQHLCPTAEGVTVTAEAELTKVDGRFFEFKLIGANASRPTIRTSFMNSINGSKAGPTGSCHQSPPPKSMTNWIRSGIRESPSRIPANTGTGVR